MDSEHPLPRIKSALLDWDDDLRLYNGVPFTGVAYAEYSNGQLEREMTYRDGLRNGRCREWYANGQLKREWTAEGGRAIAVKQWYESGAVKAVGHYERGVVVDYKEWSESGELIVHRTLTPEAAKRIEQLKAWGIP